MPFRCIIHLEKHNAIGEGVAGHRHLAVERAYNAVRGNRSVYDTSDYMHTLLTAEGEALRLARYAPVASVESSMPELGFSVLIERCDAPLT